MYILVLDVIFSLIKTIAKPQTKKNTHNKKRAQGRNLIRLF